MHDRRVSNRTRWEASSVGERLKWAIRRKRFGTNELGQHSGTTGGYVSKLSARPERIAGNAEKLFALAQALDVSAAWLAFGIGQPTEDDVPPLPNREVAAALCRAYGIAEDAIASVIAEIVVADDDLPVLAWVDRMRLREAQLRSVRTAG